jgi:glutamyl-tRNA synthetase
LSDLRNSGSCKNVTHSLVELAVKPVLEVLNQPSTSSYYPFFQSITRPEDRENIIQRLVFADAQNYTNPAEFSQRNIYFFTHPSLDILKASIPSLKLHHVPLQYSDALSPLIVAGICQTLLEIPDCSWGEDSIRSCLAAMISSGLKLTMENRKEEIETLGGTESFMLGLEKSWVKLIHQYLRWALVASKPGPNSVLTMELLGEKETHRRLLAAEELLKEVS